MEYTVKRGDNLWTLARKYGVTLQELLRQVPDSVQKDPRKLQPGMKLTVPGQEPQAQVPYTQAYPIQNQSYQMPRQQPIADPREVMNQLKQPEEINKYLGMAMPQAGLGSGMAKAVGGGLRNMCNKASMNDYKQFADDMYNAREAQIGKYLDQRLARTPMAQEASRMEAPLPRQLDAGLGMQPMPGQASALHPHPSRLANTISPNPGRPPTDFRRLMEENPDMTLEDLYQMFSR